MSCFLHFCHHSRSMALIHVEPNALLYPNEYSLNSISTSPPAFRCLFIVSWIITRVRLFLNSFFNVTYIFVFAPPSSQANPFFVPPFCFAHPTYHHKTTHKNIVAVINMVVPTFTLTPVDAVLGVLPFYHIYGAFYIYIKSFAFYIFVFLHVRTYVDGWMDE